MVLTAHVVQMPHFPEAGAFAQVIQLFNRKDLSATHLKMALPLSPPGRVALRFLSFKYES